MWPTSRNLANYIRFLHDEVTGSEEVRYRILRALDAAGRSVQPVRDGLPRPLADVYRGTFGFTIARHTGPKSRRCLLRQRRAAGYLDVVVLARAEVPALHPPARVR